MVDVTPQERPRRTHTAGGREFAGAGRFSISQDQREK